MLHVLEKKKPHGKINSSMIQGMIEPGTKYLCMQLFKTKWKKNSLLENYDKRVTEDSALTLLFLLFIFQFHWSLQACT